MKDFAKKLKSKGKCEKVIAVANYKKIIAYYIWNN
jgi:hypothetical protein